VCGRATRAILTAAGLSVRPGSPVDRGQRGTRRLRPRQCGTGVPGRLGHRVGFSDVEDHRLGGAVRLVDDVTAPAAGGLAQQPVQLHGYAIGIEPLVPAFVAEQVVAFSMLASLPSRTAASARTWPQNSCQHRGPGSGTGSVAGPARRPRPAAPAPAPPPGFRPRAVRPVAQPATDLREAVVLSVTRRSQERPGFCLTGIRSRNIRSPSDCGGDSCTPWQMTL